ncbi:SDR family oxidoreductase [Streptomyces sp. HSW2009]|uniref:SDR family oxidoreductase n=1 Tax=Streptomyces sp. HSW2009 TaxID=3142890 RepID=UPI0032EC6A2A
MSTSDTPGPTITPPLAGRTVVILGGGSGFGRAVARRSVAAGAHVVLGGRTAERLAAVAEELGERVSWRTVDTTDQASLADFFAPLERIDHLFTPAASYQTGPMLELDDEAAESPFTSKFWGQYYAVKHAAPRLSADGSVVLVSGAASVRPFGAAPAYVACNAAIEGLGRGLAAELAPVRVNVVSPGAIDGDLWGRRPAEVREDGFARYSEATVLRRIGTEDEVADAVLFLFGNGNMTGSTLYPDGGYALR